MLASGRSLSSRFTLLRPLGQGGMGDVWLVHDQDLDEELVAKIVPNDTSDDALTLLRRECRQARRLVHPNIGQVFDFHRGDEHSFVTMAFVDGEPLARLRGKPVAQILAAVVPIADALAYAHRQGVVHRDVKLANVRCDAGGAPRLLDFGIAGITGGAPGLELRGGGSRASMSPQQLAGEAPSPADDVYAFGVMLYELITGQPPFWPDVTDEDVQSTVPAPMASHHPLPPRLAALVAAMLAKSPGDRPADMETVRRTLQEIRDERLTAPPRLTPPREVMVSPPPAPRTPPAALPRRGGRGLMWVTALLFAGLAVAAVAVFVALPDWVRARQQSTRLEPPAGDAGESPFAGDLEDPAAEEEPVADAEPEPELEPGAPPAVHQAPSLGSTPPPAAPRTPAPQTQSPRTLAPPAPPPGDRAFEQAMSEGLAALDRADYPAARDAFSRAAELRPGSPQSADGLARADGGLRLAKILALRDQAAALEAGEDWHAAMARYQAVLALDPAVELAQRGRDRAGERAELSDRLSFHLANPGRLSSGEVLEEASAVLARASAIDPAGPRLRGQISELTAQVRAFSTPVAATLESDGLTEVVIYKVGRLGAFSRHQLELRPGSYTVVGSRRGFRDVRRQLEIVPGLAPAPLTIRCEEKI